MQLLVSVADAADAGAAVDGGADIVDAKDPSRGPLGSVSAPTLTAIIAAVRGRRPVSAAFDVHSDSAFGTIDRLRRMAFVKIAIGSGSAVGSNVAAAKRAAEIAGCALVLAAYADRSWAHIVDVAARCGAYGVLLDTSDKDGPGLFRLVSEEKIDRWVEAAHEAGLVAALAGRLTADDLPRAAALGADIAGVRGAACEGGRGGRVSVERVRTLASISAPTGISPMPAFL
jgi:uncharacterized protein (UPF0264 family)